MSRVYHPVNEWEEVAANMWGEVKNKKAFLQKAISFTGNHVEYGSYMVRVVNEWPVSCENALTDPVLNKRAWLGHAACAMAISCPEDITRQAWKYLTDEQRLLANKAAARAIRQWEDAYLKGRGLCEDMGGTLLFEGYS